MKARTNTRALPKLAVRHLLALAILSCLNACHRGSPFDELNSFSTVKFAEPTTPDRCKNIQLARKKALAWLDSLQKYADKATPYELFNWRMKRGLFFARQNDSLAPAIEEFQKAYEIGKKLNQDTALTALYELGSVQMRAGEQANCVKNHNSETCTFPLSKLAEHKDQSGARAAIQSFTEYLKHRPHDTQIRWVLNILYQTVGEYPQKVPQEFLMPPELFKDKKFPRFRNIAGELGLQKYEMEAGGALADDFRNSGYLDILFGSIDYCEPIHYFENHGKDGFVDRSHESGLDQIGNFTMMSQADFRNNGRLSIYFSRGSWETPDMVKKLGKAYNALMENQGDGTFKDVTQEVGLKTNDNVGIAASWADTRNTGWLDLLVCNSFRPPELFLNDHGHFTLAKNSGIQMSGNICKSASFADLNHTGYPDLFLTYVDGKNALYLNNGNGTFRKANIPLLENTPRYGFNSWFFDYDNDGFPDLFVSTYCFGGKCRWNFANERLAKVEGEYESIRLFRNLGNYKFEDVTEKVGLRHPIDSMGGNFGDLTNSGFLDIFLGTGNTEFTDLAPNRMFRNIDGQRFEDISFSGGFSNLQKGHGIVFADFRNNGLTDVLSQYGGKVPADRGFPSLYMNPGNQNQWIDLKLRGIKANRSGLGSHVHIVLATNKGERHIYRDISSGGSFGSNPLRLHVGIGGATMIKELRIDWAGSHMMQVFRNIKPNRIYEAVENEPELRVSEAKSFAYDLSVPAPHHHH